MSSTPKMGSFTSSQSAKIITKFISKQDKETITRLNLSQEITEIEFKQKTDVVTESLLKAKCMYIMSIVFAVDLPNDNTLDAKHPAMYNSSKSEQMRRCPELVRFLELLVKNNMSSTCIFIPFRSINEYIEKFPLTILLFVKHDMKDMISGDEDRDLHSTKSSKPICYHLVYRSNGSNKVDTYKTITEAYARITELSKHTIQQYICQFQELENKEYYISVRELTK